MGSAVWAHIPTVLSPPLLVSPPNTPELKTTPNDGPCAAPPGPSPLLRGEFGDYLASPFSGIRS